MNTRSNDEESEFLFYRSNNGAVKVQIILGDESVWASQKTISELFNVEVPAISKHINNIYSDNELNKVSTISKMEIVQKEGNRNVARLVDFYNLDMIIAVGYRVNSYEATQFRIWASKVLKEYLIKGFALDDERLKQDKQFFGKDYFEELHERITDGEKNYEEFRKQQHHEYKSDFDKVIENLKKEGNL